MKIHPYELLAASALLVPQGPDCVAAQSTAFTYQGRLSAGQAPAAGVYDLRFTLYDAPTGGDAVAGPLTNSLTVLSNGLITVALDFGSSVFDGADRWLEIGVRTNGSVADFVTLQPRQAITPTPYALRSANLSGPISDSQLSTNVALLNSGPTFTGVVTAAAFSGGAAGLTNIPGSFHWEVVAGTSQQAQPNTGYIVTNSSQVTITLPASRTLATSCV